MAKIAAAYSLYLDHEKFGCGIRDYVAMPGRKWVRVIELATGESAQISQADFLGAVRGFRNRRHATELKTARVARRLRRNAKTFGNAASPHIKAALRLLRAAVA